MDTDRREARARAFDYLFDAVVVTDLQGVIIDWNAGAEALYGYSREEVIGQPVSLLHVPEDVDRITTEVLDAVAAAGRWTGEVRMLHRDGSIGWIESMVVPLLGDDGRMAGALGINRDISARRRNEERLAYLAHHDPLTGLPNRYLLIERMQQMIDHARRERSGFSLLYVDLDNFKEVNDRYGHAMGDRVLVHAAQCLQQALRTADTLARLGGDEFVVLLDESRHPHGPEVVAGHLQAALALPMILGERAVSLQCSIGIAGYPADGQTVDELLSGADHAMYRNKSGSGQRRSS